MIGILLISHGEFSDGIASSLSMFFDGEKQIDTMKVSYDTNIDFLKVEMADKIKELDTGDGVLILADIFGGSPCNTTFNYLKDNIEVVSGMNFPMVLSAITGRKTYNNLKELATKVIEDGMTGIINVREKLGVNYD